ncbi:uncharacterized protein [Littorina saxatilis]|uniref:Uncharacterized protein n=1 Tax=Littorina saxatilis TaxID=31220 RepID=A0AAN9FZR4_9CAEN
MPSLTEFGLLVALGLMTALVFQGYYFPGTPGQTTSQSDGRPGKADPDGYQFDPEKLSETVKLNWCKENPDRCPMGKFPTEGPEADLVRHLSAAHDTLIPSSINVGQGNDGFWPPTPDPLVPSSVLDNDRCCPTNNSFLPMIGKKTNFINQICIFPPYKDWPTQIVSIGSCYGSSPIGCTQVNGACEQATRYVQLLCRFELTNRVRYTWFEANSYCTCSYSAPP